MSKTDTSSTTEESISRATTLLNEGDNQGAQTTLRALPSSLPRVSYLLAFAEAREGNLIAALSRLQRILDKESDFILALALKQELQRLLEPLEKSELDSKQEDQINEEIEITSESLSSEEMLDLALLHLQEGRLEKAQDTVQRAIEMEIPARDLYYTAAIIALQYEDFELGKKSLEKELELFPDNDAATELLSELTVNIEERQ